MLGSSESCYICKKGYLMLIIDGGETCIPQTAKMDGCYWTDNNDYCTWCDYGYYFSSANGTCLPTEMTAMYRKIVGRWEIISILLFILVYFPPVQI